jgi:hypothetical protein
VTAVSFKRIAQGICGIASNTPRLFELEHAKSGQMGCPILEGSWKLLAHLNPAVRESRIDSLVAVSGPR